MGSCRHRQNVSSGDEDNNNWCASWIAGVVAVEVSLRVFNKRGILFAGFPRIGPNREMKKALELYWKGGSTLSDLLAVADQVDKAAWKLQADAGIDFVGLDGTLYDQVLDWIFSLGLAPPRFKACLTTKLKLLV